MKNKIALVVIVYGKALEDSLTIQSLLSFDQGLDRLLIVHNGPSLIDQHNSVLADLAQKHHQVVLENHTENKPLSWIYNDFIRQYEADCYVLFDDDIEINAEYQNTMFTLRGVDVELPKIISISDQKQYYPLVGSVVEQNNGMISTSLDILSIGSGLMISKAVKRYFLESKLELFDSHFALYGVDFSFFTKINAMEKKNKVFKISSKTYIHHSLSRAEGEMNAWREKERVYDVVLTLRYYSSYAQLRILKLALTKILRGKINDAVLVVSAAVTGVHPRCKAMRDGDI